MQSVVFDQFGEPAEVLRVKDQPVPVPKKGEVRVRMLASPVNPSDLMMIRGRYGLRPTLPATPGFEGIGVVESSGGGLLGRLMVGKRVAVLNSSTGNWCEQTVVTAKQVIPLSRAIPIDQGAMFFVNPVTAYVMTRRVLQVPAGAWLLQTAAGSALGKMVIRLGKEFGFRTLNIVRRSAQIEELKRLGADAVVSTESPTWTEEVRRLTNDQGVPFALDPVGGATGSGVVSCLAVGGRMLLFGSLQDESVTVSPRELLTSVASIEGFWLARYMTRLGLLGKLKLIRKVSGLVQRGVLTSEIGATYPLAEIQAAVRAAEAPARGGKILLSISQER